MTRRLNDFLKRFVSRCGLIVPLAFCCLNAGAQEPGSPATDAKTASIERAEPDEALSAAMEKYLQSAKDKKLNIQSVMVCNMGKSCMKNGSTAANLKRRTCLTA